MQLVPLAPHEGTLYTHIESHAQAALSGLVAGGALHRHTIKLMALMLPMRNFASSGSFTVRTIYHSRIYRV